MRLDTKQYTITEARSVALDVLQRAGDTEGVRLLEALTRKASSALQRPWGTTLYGSKYHSIVRAGSAEITLCGRAYAVNPRPGIDIAEEDRCKKCLSMLPGGDD